MSDSPLQEKRLNKTPLSEDEQLLLDTALQESDQLLARSLHDDQRRRKRRRIWLSVLLIGGVVMSLTSIAIVAGWLAVSTPVTAEVDKPKPKVSDEQWKSRLLALKEGGNWFEGAQVGMELVLIPGDRPYDLLKANWPNIATSAKKQILKGFTPGMMGNKEHHPRFFEVMHLGMTDPDADVKSYAATYIEMQGLPNFKNNLKGYALWWEVNKDRSAEDIVAGEDPAAHGWKMFSSGRSKAAERLFRKALEEEPKNLSALNGLGFVLLNQGDHQQAKPLFEKCLKFDKKAAGPMNGVARCLKAQGKVDKAIELWEKMAEIYPGPTAATAGLAQTHLEREEYAQSVKYYKILVKSDPSNKHFQEGLLKAVDGLTAGN